MQIAVLSDTHDNIWKLDQALPLIRTADAIIHCGDLCSPFMVVRLGKGVGDKPVHVVFGNNDGDPRLLTLKALETGNVHLHGQFASLEFDGLHLAVNHYPEIARPLALSQQFDLVCYGHDHLAHESWQGSTLLLNPGELSGINGRSSFTLVDTQTRAVKWLDL
ncbi:MAG: YfcE family phosphodiesterase [Anaerolineales bacterium]|nr:YfcE family phosphodiesterase [Anaerolineales bacterium]